MRLSLRVKLNLKQCILVCICAPTNFLAVLDWDRDQTALKFSLTVLDLTKIIIRISIFKISLSTISTFTIFEQLENCQKIVICIALNVYFLSKIYRNIRRLGELTPLPRRRLAVIGWD